MDYRVTPEDIAGMQDAMNGIEAVWNTVLDTAGKVRGRAIEIGFGPEAADQIGMLAFSQAIRMSRGEE